MPGGRTHASVSRSYSHADVRSPRFELIAWCSGVSTWSRTKIAPTNASGWLKSAPRCTAPTSAPIATANSTGSTPRRTRTVHHNAASAASALGRTEKNCQALRPRSPLTMGHLAISARRHAGRAVKGADEIRQVGEADIVGDVGHRSIGAREKTGGAAQARA